MLPNTNPLLPDNQVQELIRIHQHGYPILSRILQLHKFLYSGYFTDRAALYYLFYDPSILLPGNFYCQLLPGSVTALPGAINNSISIMEAHFHSSDQAIVSNLLLLFTKINIFPKIFFKMLYI